MRIKLYAYTFQLQHSRSQVKGKSKSLILLLLKYHNAPELLLLDSKSVDTLHWIYILAKF